MSPHRREVTVSPRQIVAAGLCIGCGACVSRAADGDATMTWDSYGQLKPTGTAWLRERAVAFSKTCPFSPFAANEDELAAALFPDAKHRDPQIGLFRSAYVGHAAEADFRAAGSSGGMVTWVAAELLRRGLVDGVAHVAPTEGDQRRFFQYQISRSVEAVRGGAKSRY
jgi:coenzyme F420-reducing hydrogenase beta subunit